MECRHCLEHIKPGAQKCRTCGEYLGRSAKFKKIASFTTGAFSIIVTLASLGFAYIEFNGRVEAEIEKDQITQEKTTLEKAAADALRSISRLNIDRDIREELQVSTPTTREAFTLLNQGRLKENGVYKNTFTFEKDLADHDFYVVTIEPDDGDPAPADHILEGVLVKQ